MFENSSVIFCTFLVVVVFFYMCYDSRLLTFLFGISFSYLDLYAL